MKNFIKITSILGLSLAFGKINAQSQTFNYTGSLQTWTVPSCVTSVTIKAFGAQGGTGSLAGGMGAEIQGVFTSLNSGDVVDVLVGQQGLSNNEGSGGGGTFVWDNTNTTLLVAAGGGGGSYQSGQGGAGSATNTPTAGTGPQGSSPGGSGGNGGSGGSCTSSYAAGGGGTGWLSNGGVGSSCGGYSGGNGGHTPSSGGAGGISNVVNGCTYSSNGGYGGGGASTCYAAGGGGGYNGGGGAIGFVAGGNGAGGGGSFNGGTNQTNLAGVESGNGSVTITWSAVTGVTDTAKVISIVSCPGGSNGIAYAKVSGGTPSTYTYSWAPSGGSHDTASGLTVGTYTVTINDCGFTATSSVTITQAPGLTGVTANVINNVFCMSGSNGKIYANVSGGGYPLTYTWTPSGGSRDTASGLTAGTYTINVTDFCGTTASASATITQPASALTLSVATTANELCNGENMGSASSTVSGGGIPYTYSWSPSGGTTDTAVGLSAGTYTLNLTDNYGCTLSASTTISEPAALGTLAFTNTNVTCNGGNDGSTSSFSSGGTLPYTYSWAPAGGTQGTASGLTAGTYTLSITDSHGCTASSSTTVTQPASPLNVIANTTANETCYGESMGSVTSSTSGGTAPYTYSWAPSGATTTGITGLGIGTYTISVSDNHGCTASAETTVTQPNAVIVTLSVTSNVTCNGGFNGSISSSTSGGTVPFHYTWSGGAGSTDTATFLSAGTYTLTVTDSHGCTGSAAITVTQPNALSSSASVSSNVICNGSSSGSAVASPNGGTLPYTYSWYPSGETNANASALSAGSYTVTVNDACGASATSWVTITQANAMVVSASPSGNVLCNGNSDGSATSSIRYGTAPYTYSWTGGQTSGSATGLSSGTYTLTVTDINGCSGSATTVITQPVALQVSVDSVPDDGKCTGSAWVTVEGGTSPYTYLWSNGNTNYLAPNLCKGHYCCKVTDANGCEDSLCATVISYLGIDNIRENAGNITVYPNPNNGEFTMETSVVSGQWSVEVYNILGEKVYSQLSTQNSQVTINISNQPNGVYLYRVLTENGSLLGDGKIIIQK